MNCSTNDTYLTYADCQLISLHAPEAGFLAVVICLVLSCRSLRLDENGELSLETKQPSVWKIGTWSILIPGTYSIAKVLQSVINWSSEDIERAKKHSAPFG